MDIIAYEANKDRKRARKDVHRAIVAALKKDKLPVPKLSTLMSKISKARQAPISELDAPWSLASLIEHPIPPDVLPVVLKVFKMRMRERERILRERERMLRVEKGSLGEGDFTGNELTIREALWVSRLSALTTKTKELDGWATWYAVRQRAYEALGQLPDTSDLDEMVMGLARKNTAGKTTVTARVNGHPIDLEPFGDQGEE